MITTINSSTSHRAPSSDACLPLTTGKVREISGNSSGEWLTELLTDGQFDNKDMNL